MLRGNNKSADAFLHMVYTGQHPSGHMISISIWNSRDGVTPFSLRYLGTDLLHNGNQRDFYNPGYKPKRGELIWVSYDEQSARELGERYWANHEKEWSEIKDLNIIELGEKFGKDYVRYNLRSVLENIIEDGKDNYIAHTIRRQLQEHGEPQPRLVEVAEDWT